MDLQRAFCAAPGDTIREIPRIELVGRRQEVFGVYCTAEDRESGVLTVEVRYGLFF